MFNFFKITSNTFKESVREPIFFLMLFAALVLIGHYPSAALFVFSEQLKLVVDSSMATSLIFGLVAGVLCASHTVAREMRNGTVLLLPGDMIVVAPEDAHKPRVAADGPEFVRKVVVKVKV